MLTKEQKDKWVAALRSGEYKQGRTELRQSTNNGMKYCCLGVLCDINGIRILSEHDVHYEFLRTLVLGEMFTDRLTRMNDFEGDDFTVIADYIEKELPVCDVLQIPKESNARE